MSEVVQWREGTRVPRGDAARIARLVDDGWRVIAWEKEWVWLERGRGNA
jgi:hypothetical protein